MQQPRLSVAMGALLALGSVGGCSKATIAPCRDGDPRCARDGGPGDAGPRDGGGPDAGGVDAGAADAAAMDAGPPDGGSEQPSYRLQGGVVMGSARGGVGGSSYELACRPTEVAVGHEGGVDPIEPYPNWYALRCAELHPDGTLTAERSTTLIASDPALCGHTLAMPWIERCPPGSFLVGLHGSVVRWAGGTPVIDRLGITCAPLAQWLRDATGAERLPAPTGSTRPSLEDFDELCPAGHVLTQISGTHGCLIDSLQMGCRLVTD